MTRYIAAILLLFITALSQAAPDTLQTQGWRRLTIGVSEPFYHLFVLNPDTVYVTTNSMLVRTRNGGQTWEQLITDALTRGCVWFTDDTTGFYAPTTDVIYKTSDGGEHWRAINTRIDQHVVQQMQFVGRDTGWMLYSGTILQTRNGGESWRERPTDLFSFSFANSRIGYGMKVAGDSLSKTTDGGTTWQSFAPNIPVGLIACLSPDTLISPCLNGAIAKSMDSGYNWVAHSSGIGEQIYTGVAFGGQSTGWVVTRWGAITHTRDAGETWTPQHNPTNSFLFDVGAADSSVAYAIGDSGVVLKTVNGGLSWVNVGPGWSPSIHDMVSPSPVATHATLSYELPCTQHVSVALYGVTGSLALTLIENSLQEEGVHHQCFDVSSLPAGTYVYSIQGECLYETGKFIVSRLF